jgi:hypothetical protein
MDTMNGEATTTIADLFAPDPAPQMPASTQASEQPTPPDPDYGYQPPVQEVIPPAQTQQPQGQEPPVQQQPHMVPLGELIDTRKRAQAAEEAARQTQREMQQLKEMMMRQSQPQQPQNQPQPIDPVEDPQGFANALIHQIEERFLNERLNDSERRARAEFGSANVDAALQAAQQAGFSSAFASRPDAYREMVEWHQAQQLRATIGANPTAYQEQLKAQIRAQVLAELKQGTPPPSNLPPSLSGATKANMQPEVIGSDKDWFNETLNGRKRRG